MRQFNPIVPKCRNGAIAGDRENALLFAASVTRDGAGGSTWRYFNAIPWSLSLGLSFHVTSIFRRFFYVRL